MKKSQSPNYITPSGLDALRSEYKQLYQVERPQLVEVVAWAASNGDRSENGDYIYGKKRLREIDRRLHYLLKRIESAEVVDPNQLTGEKVVFGATVTVLNEDEDHITYQIVGEDETQPEQRKISWRSPIAKALLGKKLGDEVLLRLPKGEESLEITKIEFIA